MRYLLVFVAVLVSLSTFASDKNSVKLPDRRPAAHGEFFCTYSSIADFEGILRKYCDTKRSFSIAYGTEQGQLGSVCCIAN